MRLIDAERLRAEIFKASMDEHFMPMKLLDCDTVTEIIDNAPTIEERKTGRWIKGDLWSEGCGMGETYGYYYECSECGTEVEGDYKECKYNFCPNCGAKMKGAEQ